MILALFWMQHSLGLVTLLLMHNKPNVHKSLALISNYMLSLYMLASTIHQSNTLNQALPSCQPSCIRKSIPWPWAPYQAISGGQFFFPNYFEFWAYTYSLARTPSVALIESLDRKCSFRPKKKKGKEKKIQLVPKKKKKKDTHNIFLIII